MKCRQHPYELGGVGVCASCLRERLLALVAAQNKLAANYDDDDYHRRHYHHNKEYHHELWTSRCQRPAAPPPLDFPRSVSPYVAHRRSIGSDASPARPRHHHLQRFFSTPQVGPAFKDSVLQGRRNSGKFSVMKILFRHRRSESESRISDLQGSRPNSWLSALIPGRRKKKPRPFPAGKATEKGMSPAAMEEEEADESGYSTDSSNGYQRPMPTPMRSSFPANGHYNRRPICVGAVAGFGVCLSPFVRSGNGGRRGQNAEAGSAGDLRSRPLPAGAPTFGPNRSRKLTDFSRNQDAAVQVAVLRRQRRLDAAFLETILARHRSNDGGGQLDVGVDVLAGLDGLHGGLELDYAVRVHFSARLQARLEVWAERRLRLLQEMLHLRQGALDLRLGELDGDNGEARAVGVAALGNRFQGLDAEGVVEFAVVLSADLAGLRDYVVLAVCRWGHVQDEQEDHQENERELQY